MHDVKEEIYNILKKTGFKVYQNRPEKLVELPCVTFYILNNTPSYSLYPEVLKQNIEVIVDIWAKTSKETGSMLGEIFAKMLDYKYILQSNTDVYDNAIGNSSNAGYSHLSLKFVY